MYLQVVGCGGTEWADVAQDMDRWRALVNVGLNLRISIKCGEFLDQLRTGQLLKKDFVPWSEKTHTFARDELIFRRFPKTEGKNEYLPSKAQRFLYVPPGLTFKNSTWCSLWVECFVRISEQTAAFALYIINRLVFITVVGSVYSAVRSDSLYKPDYVWSLKG